MEVVELVWEEELMVELVLIAVLMQLEALMRELAPMVVLQLGSTLGAPARRDVACGRRRK